MQKITPFLWFDGEAEQAAKFYTSIFKKSKILSVTRYPNVGQETTGRAPGSVMTVDFTIEGQRFIALNGGPIFKFNEAISFVVHCKTQKEVDYYWKKLTAGGKEVQCGWLRDKYGVSWQIVPEVFLEVWKSKDRGKRERVMAAMMEMVKLDIAGLKAAAEAPAPARGGKAKRRR
jgi:predicted 3-demethylubiquinone-9 3-methyltransferase (glyoxalase superfamily)